MALSLPRLITASSPAFSVGCLTGGWLRDAAPVDRWSSSVLNSKVTGQTSYITSLLACQLVPFPDALVTVFVGLSPETSHALLALVADPEEEALSHFCCVSLA